MKNNLESKIAEKEAQVAVIGLGYVGLPLAVTIAKAGFRVTGIDTDESRVSSIKAGNAYILDVANEELQALVQKARINPTSDYRFLQDSDVILICVPTPVNSNKEPDLSPIEAVAAELARYAPKEREFLIVLQSTTFPGTTEELILPRMSQDGLQVGRDFYLAFSPERIDPGNPDFNLRNIPMVVGGVTPTCTQMAVRFLSAFVSQVIPVSSPKIAEMTKLLENIFRCVNIALVNELMMLADRLGIDIWEVIEAASTKPFGFMPFYPGPGVGGHCIPVDPFYLAWKAREYDFYVNFIQLAAQINDNMPYYITSRIVEILSDRGQSVRGARILLLGMTFKKNVADTRNSPSIRVAELLMAHGAHIEQHDPWVPTVSVNGTELKSIDLSQTSLESYDAVVILVPHSCYDVAHVVRHARLVIDTRNATGHLGELPSVICVGRAQRASGAALP